jgi:hypothetical protein
MSGPTATSIHELRHRLQTLATDLREASQCGVITEHDFQARMRRIGRSDEYARKLLSVLSAQTLSSDLPTQVDLPVMSDASRVEQKIVSRFVKDTKVYTKDLAAKVRLAVDWSYESADGSTGWFVAMLRLSRIKTYLRKVDQDLESVRRARTVIEDFISKSEISGNEPNPSKKQRDLLAAFQEFEAATGRVTSLRARLSGEIARNQEMKHWLEQYAHIRRQKSDAQLPPETDQFHEIFQSASAALTGGAKLAKDRLVIARQLVGALEGVSAPTTTVVKESERLGDLSMELKTDVVISASPPVFSSKKSKRRRSDKSGVTKGASL